MQRSIFIWNNDPFLNNYLVFLRVINCQIQGKTYRQSKNKNIKKSQL